MNVGIFIASIILFVWGIKNFIDKDMAKQIDMMNNMKNNMKNENYKKLETIFNFLYKNDIILDKEYSSFDKNINFLDTESEETLNKTYYMVLRKLIDQISAIYYEYKSSRILIINDLEFIYANIKNNEFSCYKEEMLFISWILQIYYMKYKLNIIVLNQEQIESLTIIKNQFIKIDKIKKALENEEKERLLQSFQEENQKLNTYIKNIFNEDF